MATTREQAMQALFAILKASGDFVVTGRRNRSPDSIGPAQSPAAFLVKAGETYVRQSLNLPPRRTLNVRAFLYNDVGPDLNAVPETAINAALDALDALVKPDNQMTGCFTLGGLVTSCMISGEIKSAAGEVTGKAIAIVPFEILLP